MGLNYNNPVDEDLMPNQASPGPNYEFPLLSGKGPFSPAVITRQGVITRVDLINRKNQAAAQSFQFAPVGEGPGQSQWALGDTVFIQAPSGNETGAATISILDINGDPLCTWSVNGSGTNSANGGMFVYGANVNTVKPDFGAVIPGVSST